MNAGSKGPGKGTIRWAGRGAPSDTTYKRRFAACARVTGHIKVFVREGLVKIAAVPQMENSSYVTEKHKD